MAKSDGSPIRIADIREGQTRRFCYGLLPGVEPGYVIHQAVTGAKIGECFDSVEQQVRFHGGEKVIGWAIWLWPKVLIEAERHAVWRDPEGVLMDITPRPKGMRVKKITFLPDMKSGDEGRGIDNVRKNIAGGSRRELVSRYIAQAERAAQALYQSDDPDNDSALRQEQHKLFELQEAISPSRRWA